MKIVRAIKGNIPRINIPKLWYILFAKQVQVLQLTRVIDKALPVSGFEVSSTPWPILNGILWLLDDFDWFVRLCDPPSTTLQRHSTVKALQPMHTLEIEPMCVEDSNGGTPVRGPHVSPTSGRIERPHEETEKG